MPPTRTAEHGRRSTYQRGCRCDACRAWRAAYTRQWKISRGMPVVDDHGRRPHKEPQVPIEPLLEAVYAYLHPQGLGVQSLGTRDAQVIWRAAKRGTISCHLADRIIVGTLGRHPAEVYGWEWYTLEITEDA